MIFSRLHDDDDDYDDEGNGVDSDWDPNVGHVSTAVKFKDVEDDDELDREVRAKPPVGQQSYPTGLTTESFILFHHIFFTFSGQRLAN